MRAAQQSGNLVNSERPAKETWPADTLEFNRPEKGSLFQRGADRGEIGAELSADALNGDDDRDGDAGGDQTVFNGGFARFGDDELFQNSLLTCLPGVALAVPNKRQKELGFSALFYDT